MNPILAKAPSDQAIRNMLVSPMKTAVRLIVADIKWPKTGRTKVHSISLYLVPNRVSINDTRNSQNTPPRVNKTSPEDWRHISRLIQVLPLRNTLKAWLIAMFSVTGSRFRRGLPCMRWPSIGQEATDGSRIQRNSWTLDLKYPDEYAALT